MKALFLETSMIKICLKEIEPESCGPITFLLLVLVGKIFVDLGGHRYNSNKNNQNLQKWNCFKVSVKGQFMHALCKICNGSISSTTDMGNRYQLEP